jgi:hypothetical protein
MPMVRVKAGIIWFPNAPGRRVSVFEEKVFLFVLSDLTSPKLAQKR